MRILLLNQPLIFPNFLSSSVTPSVLLFSAATKGGRAARQRSYMSSSVWEDRFTFYMNQIRNFWIWKRRVDSSHQAYSAKNGLLILSHFGYGPKCKVQNKFAIIVWTWVPIYSKKKNLDSVLKSRDIMLLTEVHIVKAVVLPIVMYRCESWTIKKAEHWRIDALSKHWTMLASIGECSWEFLGQQGDQISQS